MTIFTHQCKECGNTVLHVPGTCDVCIAYMKQQGTWVEPAPKFVYGWTATCYCPQGHDPSCVCRQTGLATFPTGAFLP